MRSVFYRGLFKTLQLLSYEKRYEKLFGINTAQIKKSDDADNFHYQGAGYMVLLDVLKQIPDDYKSLGFIDYGSGKGRALFCAEYCGFNRLIGVEMDKELNQMAQKNLTAYTKKRTESHFEFVNENALHFTIPKGTAVFYFFNPFSDKIMDEVAKKISNYAEHEQQDVLIVYLNPKYKEVWLKNGFMAQKTIKTHLYTEAILFKKKLF